MYQHSEKTNRKVPAYAKLSLGSRDSNKNKTKQDNPAQQAAVEHPSNDLSALGAAPQSTGAAPQSTDAAPHSTGGAPVAERSSQVQANSTPTTQITISTSTQSTTNTTTDSMDWLFSESNDQAAQQYNDNHSNKRKRQSDASYKNGNHDNGKNRVTKDMDTGYFANDPCKDLNGVSDNHISNTTWQQAINATEAAQQSSSPNSCGAEEIPAPAGKPQRTASTQPTPGRKSAAVTEEMRAKWGADIAAKIAEKKAESNVCKTRNSEAGPTHNGAPSSYGQASSSHRQAVSTNRQTSSSRSPSGEPTVSPPTGITGAASINSASASSSQRMPEPHYSGGPTRNPNYRPADTPAPPLKKQRKDEKKTQDKPAPKSFGQRMLEQQGWSEGKGLGANLEGITSAVRVVADTSKRLPASEGGSTGVTMGRFVGGERASSTPATDGSSRVIKVKDMVQGYYGHAIDDMLLNQDLEVKIRRFFTQYGGDVDRIRLLRNDDRTVDYIFIKFEEIDSARAALAAIGTNPRPVFQGNYITGGFYNEAAFDSGNLFQ